jgi:hypothetical protein
MSEIRQKRNYRFHELNLSVSCSAAVAASLDSRFRLLSLGEANGETISFDFQSVPDEKQHRIKRPLDQGRPFYEFPSGEAFYFAESDQIYLRYGEGVRVLARPGLGRATFSIIESDPVNLFLATHLMLTILLVEILKRCGFYSVHASGFCEDNKAILIPGTSGVGKSTLALTLLRSGFGYLSDDMVFLRRHAGELQMLGFPEDIDVSDQSINFFPELDCLRSLPKSPAQTKRQVRADEIYRAEIVHQARPVAIVFPKISAKEQSQVRPIPADEGLIEMVSNILLTDGRSCQNHLDILTELVKQTPCYRLETGRDFDRIPIVLRELLLDIREEIHA